MARRSREVGCHRAHRTDPHGRHPGESPSLPGIRGLALPRHSIGASRTEVIREVRPNVVHSNTAIILTPGIAALVAGVPHIWHVRESFGEFGRLWSVFQWYMFACSTRVICVSDAVRQQFVPFIRERKTTVIHNGIPASEFGTVSDDRIQEFRRTFGLKAFFSWALSVD
ncbi:MAG: glycosyltransferase [Ignavibacteriae bacterium]|nr:glycosyltransferase [Ignavibacteriota bacterium]